MLEKSKQTMYDAILFITDQDVFSEVKNEQPEEFTDRITGKVVLFNDEGKVALIANNVHSYDLLPGGGIDEGEDIEVGVMRECKEETGCTVSLEQQIGITEDYRNRGARHCISYGYIGKVLEHGEPQLTDSEKDIGAHVIWVTLEEAIEKLEESKKQVQYGNVPYYNTCFNTIRDLEFLKQAQQLLG